VPLREAFEQVAAQAAELSAKLAIAILKVMRNILEIMVLSTSLFFAALRLSNPEFPFCPQYAADTPGIH
jgi:hypothetical protein